MDQTPPERAPRASWAARHRRPLGIAGAVLAAVLAIVWCFVVPEKAAQTDGIQSLAIRWGHPLCWALLSLACLATALGTARPRDALLWAAAASYAAFLLALVL